MKKNFTLLLLFLVFTGVVQAQKTEGSVRGKLLDTLSKLNIPDATISVVAAVDSSFITFTLSNKQGDFEIKGLADGDYKLVISHQSYQVLSRQVSIKASQKTVELGDLILEKNIKSLGEVVVTSNVPIVVKNDTVQFNADAFKTKPNATAEDLLKKLPGVEVDKDGNVKAQGEQVQKVYVDGKEFFGNDPKLATKNLTAEMIESVQVFDDMSEQAKFTKIDDGSRSKTMNIKLKKDRNKGFFGRALAGIGSNDRYETNLSINKFSGNQRISFLFNANNINKQGFSFTDVISTMGGFSGFGGGGGAMMAPRSAIIAPDREKAIQAFQREDEVRVFLISLKAGGVGLNLTAADYVYIVDPWWNPAVEQQAIDRTHRIGQTKNIFAYRMICKDTIEDKIIQLQEKKRALAKDIISDDTSFVKALTREDVEYLFS